MTLGSRRQEAAIEVPVLDADGLHERVGDDRADHPKPRFPQRFGHPAGLRVVHPAIAPGGFTRREHEIAKLLSNGSSNKNIAAATSLSIRTVEGHIYQASAKAGVTTRSELSALVQQLGQLETPRTG